MRKVELYISLSRYFVNTITSADDPAGTTSAGGPFQAILTGTR